MTRGRFFMGIKSDNKKVVANDYHFAALCDIIQTVKRRI